MAMKKATQPSASEKKQAAKQSGVSSIVLRAAAIVVAVAALAVTIAPRLIKTNAPAGETTASGDLVFSAQDIGAQASYFDYDADGQIVEVFAVRAGDGTVRLALNTCQVCNGSPYAYFVEQNGYFICQNCGNAFAADSVGKISSGCNPVPITKDVYQEKDGVITIPASFLEENAYRFVRWKQF